ncbi:YqgE/AlgH family protein [Mucilaginibacter koreensis]
MLTSVTAAAGRLLLSEPFMLDPNFKRSVVLLAEHSADGVMGYVLNHQSEYLLGDIMPDVSYSELPVYVGGPVGNDTLHFIHRCPDKIDGGTEIYKGIYWGGNFATVKELINTYQLTEDEIRFFAGYSGWSQEQLEGEIQENSWLVAAEYDINAVFTTGEHNMWKEVIVSMGQRYAHIANFPENPTLN